jgi:Fe(3+) dicitrate transport protein
MLNLFQHLKISIGIRSRNKFGMKGALREEKQIYNTPCVMLNLFQHLMSSIYRFRITKSTGSLYTVRYSIIFSALLFGPINLIAQTGTVRGVISNQNGEVIPGATVYFTEQQHSTNTDANGNFEFLNIPYGSYRLAFYFFGKETIYKNIDLNKPEVSFNLNLKDLNQSLKTVTVSSEKDKAFGRNKLMSVENFGIYEGKKTEVIELSEVTANTATNNARQVYAKITGLNIWESDGAGLQLGIGGRGLSPNRTANFNVRQNGYDISADALGYPESYYTPPLEALDRIELVRGAASLQYGTQFGGMLNFRFKKGPEDKPIEVTSRQTAGSWGFFNSFNSVGGTVAKGKVNYYTYFQHKRGNGFRPNSGFSAYNGFGAISYQATKKLKIDLELTKMQYLAQQPGGLTDKNFEQNPRQSFRERNWFQVDWNMAAVNITYEFNEQTQINSRSFGLSAHRYALGNLERINVVDFGGNRTFISGNFNNIGNETRLLHKYRIGKEQHTFLIGTRAYRGITAAKQGDGTDASCPDFIYLNPHNLENSDYAFTNKNFSAFIENIFNLTEKWSITPGIRFEYIGTFAAGYYSQRVFDGAGNLVVQTRNNETMDRLRDFVIGGIGTNYKVNEKISLYANITQNYRAVNFSDIRIVNPNFKVDPDIKDETGYTADIGIRSKRDTWYSLELTTFMIKYNNKIGQILRSDQAPLYLDYRFRGNISDARNMGLEFFGEMNFLRLIKRNIKDFQWTAFVNCAYVDARYISTADNSIRDKKVEMVPPLMVRTGTQVKFQSFRAAFQLSHLSQHFTDATNAVLTSTAVEGIIPSYQVADLSVAYQYKRYGIEASVNNIFNQMYFTRRAEGYPGPGILPSDGRGFFVTLTGKF